MAIITVANTKGGVGKSTIAANLAAGIEHDGRPVSVFDLDLQQRSLSQFINARHHASGPGRRNMTLADLRFDPHLPAEARRLAFQTQLEGLARDLSAKGAVVLIDLPAGGGAFAETVLGMTDVLITPMNDSFVDLNAIEATNGEIGELGRLVASARRRRKEAGQPAFHWAVMLNRVSPLESLQSQPVRERLHTLSRIWSFALAGALTERLAHRALFDQGRTLVDQAAAQNASAPSLEHGLEEIISLLRVLGLGGPNGRQGVQ